MKNIRANARGYVNKYTLEHHYDTDFVLLVMKSINISHPLSLQTMNEHFKSRSQEYYLCRRHRIKDNCIGDKNVKTAEFIQPAEQLIRSYRRNGTKINPNLRQITHALRIYKSANHRSLDSLQFRVSNPRGH